MDRRYDCEWSILASLLIQDNSSVNLGNTYLGSSRFVAKSLWAIIKWFIVKHMNKTLEEHLCCFNDQQDYWVDQFNLWSLLTTIWFIILPNIRDVIPMGNTPTSKNVEKSVTHNKFVNCHCLNSSSNRPNIQVWDQVWLLQCNVKPTKC